MVDRICGSCGKEMIWKEDKKSWECPDFRKEEGKHGFMLPDKIEKEDKRECPLCHRDLPKIDGVAISFNGLCQSCARATYLVWENFVEKSPIEKKLDKLIACVIPVIEDMSKYLIESKGVVKDTTFPRRQPNKKEEVPMCGNCEGKNKAVYIHKECYKYGLCKECYDNKSSELIFPKEEYEPINTS